MVGTYFRLSWIVLAIAGFIGIAVVGTILGALITSWLNLGGEPVMFAFQLGFGWMCLMGLGLIGDLLDQSRIKDLRTNVETSNTQAVLDGGLNLFIEASLKSGL